MKEHRKEHKKRVDVVKMKVLSLVKEGIINYLPRKISSPEDCFDLFKLHIDNSDREVFVVVALDTKNQPTAIQTVSIGTLNSSIVHPREVYKMAILSNASSIIIAHNHPSGDIKPSNEDIAITDRLSKAGNLLGINLLDHLIITEDSFASLRNMGVCDTLK